MRMSKGSSLERSIALERQEEDWKRRDSASRKCKSFENAKPNCIENQARAPIKRVTQEKRKKIVAVAVAVAVVSALVADTPRVTSKQYC